LFYDEEKRREEEGEAPTVEVLILVGGLAGAPVANNPVLSLNRLAVSQRNRLGYAYCQIRLGKKTLQMQCLSLAGMTVTQTFRRGAAIPDEIKVDPTIVTFNALGYMTAGYLDFFS
jgi:hypothetical protein